MSLVQGWSHYVRASRWQARVHGMVHWRGTVETVPVALGVVWIREDGIGERKLLDLKKYQLHPHNTSAR
jgi:hypothetical protein